MIDFMEPVTAALKEIMDQEFDDKDKRKRIAQNLMIWLTNEARKKPVSDLAERLEIMRKNVERMVEDMAIEIEDGKLVVKVSGSAEDTWRAFRIGTDWFEPDKFALERIFAGLFDEAGSYKQ